MTIELSWKKVFEDDLDYICEELKDQLESRSCIIFNGEVGAGKTTFIQHFMKETCDAENILSPTYSIVNEQGDFAHADFYRLVDPQEIIHLELGLYADEKKYFLVEWGKEYLNEIKLQLGDSFKYFELSIEINSSEDAGTPSRNITFKSL